MHLPLGSTSLSHPCRPVGSAERWPSVWIPGRESSVLAGTTRQPPFLVRIRLRQGSARAAEREFLAGAPSGASKAPPLELRCALGRRAEWGGGFMANPSQASEGAVAATPASSEQRPRPPAARGTDQGACLEDTLALPARHGGPAPAARQLRGSADRGRSSPTECLLFDPLSSDRAQGRASPPPAAALAGPSQPTPGPADSWQGGAQATPHDSGAASCAARGVMWGPHRGPRPERPGCAGSEAVPKAGLQQEGRGPEAGGAGPGAARESGAAVPLPPGLDAGRLPQHVAMILDGNSRWAQQRQLPKEMGHEAGVQALKRTVRLTGTWGISALTVFAFSTENWKRPKAEVDFLMALLERLLNDDIAELHREGVVVRVMGDLARLAPGLQRKIQEARELTQRNTGLKLTLAVNYSGRQDIVAACREVARQVAAGGLSPESIGEDTLEAHLGTAWLGPQLGSPDLLIRTSGEQRISNFLLWQTAYTELVFAPCLWPDFGEQQYTDCLLEFQSRDRRFGGRKAT